MFGAGGTAESFRSPSNELDRYAEEFATLVEQHRPRRGRDQIPGWIRGLPDAIYPYYRKGIASYGSDALTAGERRGRLYLTHTALLLMWMTWGKDAAKERFRTDAREGTRRAASLIQLEQYRRAGVLADYTLDDWYWQPVEEWTVSIHADAMDVSRVESDRLHAMLDGEDVVRCSVKTFTALRERDVVPPLHRLTAEDSSDKSGS